MILLTGCLGNDSSSGGSALSKNSVEYIEITAPELQDYYDNNKMQFEKNLNGKYVAITGVIDDISKDSVRLCSKSWLGIT